MAIILNIISAVTPMGGTVSKLRLLMAKSCHCHVLYHPGFENNREEIRAELEYYRSNGIPAYSGIYNRNIIKHVLAIKEIVNKHNVDIIHFYFNFEQTFVYLLKAIFPTIIFVRSYVGYVELSTFKKACISPSIRFIDENIFISQYIKKRYEQLYPLLRQRPSTIIYNCPVHIDDIDPNSRGLILYVGGLNKDKNVLLLIEMMNCVVNILGRQDVKLTIVGDGPERNLIETKIRSYDLSNNIYTLGYREDIQALLRKTKIYVHPAINEGFGISVAEAMYMKCPCIVADSSALPELIDENCGYVLPINNPMIWAIRLIELVDNPDKARLLGENAYARVNKDFSVNSFVGGHDVLYDNLLSAQR